MLPCTEFHLEIPSVRFYLIVGSVETNASGWGIGLAASMVGITLSYKLDLPTAPLIVVSLSVAFFLLLILRIGRMQRTESSMNADPSKTEGETGI